jgi:hypothetical protein
MTVAALLAASSLFAQTGSVVTVNSDNILLLNGRKVFTIGLSPGPPNNSQTPSGADALQELREAGSLLFRMNQTNNWNSQVIADQQAALDWAAQHDMYCWVNLRELSEFPSTDTNTPVSLRNVVDTFRNHPALGLWKNFDEAWWSGVSWTNLLNGYLVIKQEDTNHPVVQTHAPRGTVADLQPYNVAADVLALDIYPVAIPPPSNPPLTNTNISVVGDWTAVLGQVANGQKQCWTIEQIAFSGTTPPSHALVFPPFNQSRYMAYQALINGARGLMFFGGNIAATLNAQDAPLGWNWTFWSNVLKPVVQQLGDHSILAAALVTTNSTLPITISGTTVPDLEYVVREVPPNLYILASKREGTNATVTFSGLPAWAGAGDVLYESPRTVTAQGGQFTDSFAPFDVHVYRFAQSNQPPVILWQSPNRTNFSGTSTSCAVTADATGPLSYQWRRNGINLADNGTLSGALTPALAFANLSGADGGAYDVVVTGFGSVTSAPITVTVITNQPPVITSQPQSVITNAGTTAVFAVAATGSGPLTCQWRKGSVSLADGGNLSGAKTTTLTLASVSAGDAAAYDVVVTGFGSVTSSPPATLTVVTAPPGQLLLYEPFNYTNLGGPVSSNNPANWTYGGSPPNDLSVVNANLSYPGLAPPLGYSVTNGADGLGVRRLFSPSVNNGKLYFSALFRINNLGYGAWNGASSYAGALCATDNTSFKLGVMVRSNSPAGYVFGVQKSGTGATTTFDTTEYHAGDTVLMVGRYDFTASPNTVALWLNPSASTFGSASDPTNGFISASTGQDGYILDRFNMRQNTAASVPAAMQWDELRVGTSWAVVTPRPSPPRLTIPVPLPTGAIQFAYTNTTGSNYTVYASSNLAAWTVLGAAAQLTPGTFQFTDLTATNYPRRFYRLHSP